MKSAAAAATLLWLTAGALPALAGEGYVVIKEAGKPDVMLTDALIAKVGETEYKVKLDDVDGEVHVLKGPRLRDLLASLGASGKSVVASANDGYHAEIPASDIAGYDVIVAVAVDGKAIAADENGPARIAYPLLDVPALQTNKDVQDRLVFQLKDLTIK